MTNVAILQHVTGETPGLIGSVLHEEDITSHIIHTYEGEPVPQTLAGLDGLIVLGGPMGVYEQQKYLFLKEELRLIELALKAQLPILGICLGSELLATALGAQITQNSRKEIGWYPVTLSENTQSDPIWRELPASFTAYHWHGDVFTLPRDAVSLAYSEITTHQAFRYQDNAYGLLFHPEVTPEIISSMVTHFADELVEEQLGAQEILTGMEPYLFPLQAAGKTLFRGWARLLSTTK